MKIIKHLPAFTFACALGFAPAAFAQTSTGTMAPMSNMAPAAASAASSAATSTATTAATNAATNTAKSAMKAVTPLPKTSEFKTESEATAHCPGDTVVWSTLGKSKSYHLSSSKYFGKTKHGAYVCKADADAAGLHQAKN